MVHLNLEALDESSVSGENFVAVRIGDTQKLARIAPQRHFKFSSNAQRFKYGKLDFFQRVGTCNIDVDPHINEQTVAVPINGDTSNCFHFKVQLQGLEKRGQKGSPEKPTRAADEHAKLLGTIQEEKGAQRPPSRSRAAGAKYLEKHNFELRLAQAVQELMRLEPDDPATFIGEALRRSQGVVTRLPAKSTEEEVLPPLPKTPEKISREVRPERSNVQELDSHLSAKDTTCPPDTPSDFEKSTQRSSTSKNHEEKLKAKPPSVLPPLDNRPVAAKKMLSEPAAEDEVKRQIDFGVAEEPAPAPPEEKPEVPSESSSVGVYAKSVAPKRSSSKEDLKGWERPVTPPIVSMPSEAWEKMYTHFSNRQVPAMMLDAQVVTRIDFAFNNLDYDKVVDSPEVATSLKNQVRDGLATSLRVSPSLVCVELSKGSVKVNASISAFHVNDAEVMKKQIDASSESLMNALAASVTQIPMIMETALDPTAGLGASGLKASVEQSRPASASVVAAKALERSEPIREDCKPREDDALQRPEPIIEDVKPQEDDRTRMKSFHFLPSVASWMSLRLRGGELRVTDEPEASVDANEVQEEPQKDESKEVLIFNHLPSTASWMSSRLRGSSLAKLGVPEDRTQEREEARPEEPTKGPESTQEDLHPENSLEEPERSGATTFQDLPSVASWMSLRLHGSELNANADPKDAPITETSEVPSTSEELLMPEAPTREQLIFNHLPSIATWMSSLPRASRLAELAVPEEPIQEREEAQLELPKEETKPELPAKQAKPELPKKDKVESEEPHIELKSAPPERQEAVADVVDIVQQALSRPDDTVEWKKASFRHMASVATWLSPRFSARQGQELLTTETCEVPERSKEELKPEAPTEEVSILAPAKMLTFNHVPSTATWLSSRLRGSSLAERGAPEDRKQEREEAKPEEPIKGPESTQEDLHPETLLEEPERSGATTFQDLPSVASWMSLRLRGSELSANADPKETLMTETSEVPAPSGEHLMPEAPTREVLIFNHLPSTATWMSSLPRVSRQAELAVLEEPIQEREEAQPEEPKEETKPELPAEAAPSGEHLIPEAPAREVLIFNHLPSIATWMSSLPRLSRLSGLAVTEEPIQDIEEAQPEEPKEETKPDLPAEEAKPELPKKDQFKSVEPHIELKSAPPPEAMEAAAVDVVDIVQQALNKPDDTWEWEKASFSDMASVATWLSPRLSARLPIPQEPKPQETSQTSEVPEPSEEHLKPESPAREVLIFNHVPSTATWMSSLPRVSRQAELAVPEEPIQEREEAQPEEPKEETKPELPAEEAKPELPKKDQFKSEEPYIELKSAPPPEAIEVAAVDVVDIVQQALNKPDDTWEWEKASFSDMASVATWLSPRLSARLPIPEEPRSEETSEEPKSEEPKEEAKPEPQEGKPQEEAKPELQEVEPKIEPKDESSRPSRFVWLPSVGTWLSSSKQAVIIQRFLAESATSKHRVETEPAGEISADLTVQVPSRPTVQAKVVHRAPAKLRAATRVTFKFENLDYDKVICARKLAELVEGQTVEALSFILNVPLNAIDVQLSAGSVIVDAHIFCMDACAALRMKREIDEKDELLLRAIDRCVVQIPNIADAIVDEKVGLGVAGLKASVTSVLREERRQSQELIPPSRMSSIVSACQSRGTTIKSRETSRPSSAGARPSTAPSSGSTLSSSDLDAVIFDAFASLARRNFRPAP